MNNKDTFILLQELYDSIATLIFTYENDDWYKMVNIDDCIKDVKKCYNNLKEEENED
tara:strand:+ start:212 stop:382 length:171 start_codon:yes stop_codon:yes gene_type:complete